MLRYFNISVSIAINVFAFDLIAILLHTLIKLVRSHRCLFVCCLHFPLLLFLLGLPFVRGE